MPKAALQRERESEVQHVAKVICVRPGFVPVIDLAEDPDDRDVVGKEVNAPWGWLAGIGELPAGAVVGGEPVRLSSADP